jgi:hypothetical protein
MPPKNECVVRWSVVRALVGGEEVPRAGVEPETLRKGASGELVGLRASALALGGDEVGGELTHGRVDVDGPNVADTEIPAKLEQRWIQFAVFENDVVVRPEVPVQLDDAEIPEASEATTTRVGVEGVHHPSEGGRHGGDGRGELGSGGLGPQVGLAAVVPELRADAVRTERRWIERWRNEGEIRSSAGLEASSETVERTSCEGPPAVRA